MKSAAGLMLLSLALAGRGCGAGAGDNNNAAAKATPAAASNTVPAAAAPADGPAPTYGFEVVNSWPHDAKAFTQGLIFHDGALVESTGQYGESSLRRVELTTGRVLKQVKMPPEFFGEGLTLLDGKLYQLTWQSKRGFVYDPQTFEKVGEFRYDGEGWGLTHDGESLILSDGTNQLRFMDPSTFRVTRTVSVLDGGRPLRDLNELEYVRGEIYANLWHQDRIVRLDPRTGKVLGWIDLRGLIPRSELSDEEAVLNGIAYDAAGDRLFVTGKLWPKLFEIRVKQK
ncbi:MAG TPA: glutaminyl-peptide cyclotransferase [Pyrinomonadaceae bacterium]|nr:glutaminyl-peptide cyclotransferase [Pyrinomonadaceae bacterium]